MEVRVGIGRSQDHQVGWHDPIEPADHPPLGHGPRRRETNDLLASVNSRVSSPGNVSLDRHVKDDGQSRLNLTLNGPKFGLASVPIEVGAVVCQVETGHLVVSASRKQLSIELADGSQNALIHFVLVELVERYPTSVGHTLQRPNFERRTLKSEPDIEVQMLRCIASSRKRVDVDIEDPERGQTGQPDLFGKFSTGGGLQIGVDDLKVSTGLEPSMQFSMVNQSNGGLIGAHNKPARGEMSWPKMVRRSDVTGEVKER